MKNGDFFKRIQVEPDKICIYTYFDNTLQRIATMEKFDGPHDQMATLLASANELLRELRVASAWIEAMFGSGNQRLVETVADYFPKTLADELGTVGRVSMKSLLARLEKELS